MASVSRDNKKTESPKIIGFRPVIVSFHQLVQGLTQFPQLNTENPYSISHLHEHGNV